jgi:hypothetical protein
MCIAILKNPVAAIVAAKKKNMNRTWLVTIETAVIFALAAVALLLLNFGFASPLSGALSAASVFAFIFVASLLLGFMIKIIVTTLGGRGGYYEGLTCISYTLLPISIALLISSLVSVLPGGILLSAISIAIGFAQGVSMFYRSVKELFATDMITALVAVSILIVVLFAAAYVSFGLTTLARIGTLGLS